MGRKFPPRPRTSPCALGGENYPPKRSGKGMGNGVGRNPHEPSGGRFTSGPPGGAVGISPHRPASPCMAPQCPDSGGRARVGGEQGKATSAPSFPPHQRRTTEKIKPNRGKAAFVFVGFFSPFHLSLTHCRRPPHAPKIPPSPPPTVPPSSSIPLRGPIPPHSPFAFHWEK